MGKIVTKQISVREAINRRIQSGEFNPGDTLPSLRDLATHYQTSCGTVRLVLKELEHQLVVSSCHGSGFTLVNTSTQTRKIMLIERTGNEHLYSNFIGEFQNLIMNAGHSMLLVHPDTGGSPEKFHNHLTASGIGECDAVFFNEYNAKYLSTSEVEKLNRKARFFFYFERGEIAEILQLPGVGVDLYAGCYLAIRHLAEIGCRRVFYVGHQTRCGLDDRRYDGVRDSAADSGIELVNTPDDAAYTAVANERFDGIFCIHEVRLAKIAGILRERGIMPGRDVALLGGYNTPWGQTAHPSFTTLDIREKEMAQIVYDMYEGKTIADHIFLRPNLIIRDSTKFFKRKETK